MTLRRIRKPKKGDVLSAEHGIEVLEMGMNPFMMKETLGDRGIILINGEISKDSLAEATETILSCHFDKKFNDDIQLVINSPGGDTDAGYGFIDLMEFCRLKVRTIALGEICSMAADIFTAGDVRVISPNTLTMIHNSYGGTEGRHDDLVAFRKMDDLDYERGIKHYVKHSKYKTEDEVKRYVVKPQDNWLSPDEMIEHGLADIVSKTKTRKK